MKKRLWAATLACLLLFAFSGSAFARTTLIEPYSAGDVEGGLQPQGGGKYLLIGSVNGASGESLKIRAELRTSSGAYITEASNSGKGPTVTATKTVSLTSGSYKIYLYGTTSTHTPSKILSVTI